jgi:hypothetical protein
MLVNVLMCIAAVFIHFEHNETAQKAIRYSVNQGIDNSLNLPESQQLAVA